MRAESAKYSGVKRMKTKLNGRKVGNRCFASYFQNRAYFTKRGLTKRTVLHELYHHLASVNGLESSKRREEKDANSYVRGFLN